MSDHIHVASSDCSTMCDDSGISTDDVGEATCTKCLRLVAEEGARAAVRVLAVENGGTDKELEAERDAAIDRLNGLYEALHDIGWFHCQGCLSLQRNELAVLVVGLLKWCVACKGSP